MKLRKFIATTIREYLNEQQTLNEDIFRVDNTIKKYEKYIIDAIINFLKEEWNFNANIIVKKKQNNSLIGDISLNHNSVINNKFTLHFNPNQSYLEMIKSLIHELTHVKQVSKSELKPSLDWKSIIWNNDFEISVKEYNKIKDFNKYKELPWEEEAYKNMLDTSLRNKFFKSKYWIDLKGKDATLDYIIDNI
jgi:hypothetical protein